MWYVQYLLLNNEDIRGSGDMDSATYNDLLTVEKKIADMASEGAINPEEKELLDEVARWKSFTLAGAVLLKDRNAVSRDFDKLCERIAFSLGDYFTDEGYIEYMRDLYNLSEEHIEQLRTYINSIYKHRVLNEPI